MLPADPATLPAVPNPPPLCHPRSPSGHRNPSSGPYACVELLLIKGIVERLVESPLCRGPRMQPDEIAFGGFARGTAPRNGHEGVASTVPWLFVCVPVSVLGGPVAISREWKDTRA